MKFFLGRAKLAISPLLRQATLSLFGFRSQKEYQNKFAKGKHALRRASLEIFVR